MSFFEKLKLWFKAQSETAKLLISAGVGFILGALIL